MIPRGDLISKGYLKAQQIMHASPKGYGNRGDLWAPTVIDVARRYGAWSVLDYGAGAGRLGVALRREGFMARDYDPAIPGKDGAPGFADMVVSSDVLEHVEPEKLDAVLAHIRMLARTVVFLVASTRQANKRLPNGKNAHLIIETGHWWRAKVVAAGFTVAKGPSVLPEQMPRECWVRGAPAVTPLTVACLFVQGEYPYTPEYVTRLEAMVRRWMDRPYRFVCLTDQPWLFQSSIKTIPIAKLPNCFAYWTKLELFNPAREWQGRRVLYLDLDTLIVAPLGPILDFPAALALADDPASPGKKTRDTFGRQIVRRFNSSVMVWQGGEQLHLYDSWTPDTAKRLSGDQDHIAEQAPVALPLPYEWCPRLSQVGPPPFHPDVKVILSKFPKNDKAGVLFPWFDSLWGAA